MGILVIGIDKFWSSASLILSEISEVGNSLKSLVLILTSITELAEGEPIVFPWRAEPFGLDTVGFNSMPAGKEVTLS